MRDHNYQSRMKNCHVRFILTVDSIGDFQLNTFVMLGLPYFAAR